MISFAILLPLNDDVWNTLGLIPQFLNEYDYRPASEQFNDCYAYGGGWQPMQGWEQVGHDWAIKYLGDKTLYPVAKANLHGETICIYPHAWVAIFAQDGTFEIARMD